MNDDEIGSFEITNLEEGNCNNVLSLEGERKREVVIMSKLKIKYCTLNNPSLHSQAISH